MHSSSLIRRLHHPELDDHRNTTLPAVKVVAAVQRVCSGCWWRWLALVVVISWNSAIVTGRTPMSSSSVRRRTDVVDDVMVDLIIAPTPDERPERLDSTIMTTTTTTTITTPPPPPPPPPVDGTTAVVPNDEPQHVEAAVVAATTRTPAPTESKPQQQQQPPPAINNTNSSWDNTNNNNNTTTTTTDDDDGLFQRPTAIYQKSPELMMPSPFWWIAVGLGMIIGMIFTAWQMADYPDGLYAGLCRMILGSIQFLLSMVTLPLRKCCGVGGGSWGHYNYGGRSGHHEPYGRISTMEYGYSSSSSSSNNKNHCRNNPVLELS